jgi:hypothetical protein
MVYKESSAPQPASLKTGKEVSAMNATQIIKEALSNNDEVRLVLEITAHAREMEARVMPQEIGASTEVIAIPCNPQVPVSLGILRY